MPELLDIQITDEASLLDACDYLHDAKFTQDDVSQPAPSEWTIVCERESIEDEDLIEKTGTRIPGFFRVTCPIVRTRLTLTGIKAISVAGRKRFKTGFFNEIERVKGRYRICAPPTRWSLEFESAPQGRLQDLELLPKRAESIESDKIGCWVILGALILLAAVVFVIVRLM